MHWIEASSVISKSHVAISSHSQHCFEASLWYRSNYPLSLTWTHFFLGTALSCCLTRISSPMGGYGIYGLLVPDTNLHSCLRMLLWTEKEKKVKCHVTVMKVQLAPKLFLVNLKWSRWERAGAAFKLWQRTGRCGGMTLLSFKTPGVMDMSEWARELNGACTKEEQR